MPSSARAYYCVMRLLACLILPAVAAACGSTPESRDQIDRRDPPRRAASDAAHADGPPPPALSAALREQWTSGCFLLRTRAGLVESDHARCTTQRRPYSTFKIANALIAIDAGVLAGADAPMTWDKQRVADETYYRPEWRKPHTLRSAFKVSSVPHFRTLAHQIGAQRMTAGLARLDYGNREIGGGLDQFWLRGALRISAAQQLALVDRLARGTLDVAKDAQAAVRDISELDRKGGRVLHGKTGSGPTEDGNGTLAWQVGWIEDGADIVPYAVWLESKTESGDALRATRDRLLLATLGELGVF